MAESRRRARVTSLVTHGLTCFSVVSDGLSSGLLAQCGATGYCMITKKMGGLGILSGFHALIHSEAGHPKGV